MNNAHAMAIVCDLALCIGREVTLDALLTKVLQRLMYHCGTPVGLVLSHQLEGYKLLKAIGDDALNQQCGNILRLPPWVSEGEESVLPSPVPLASDRDYPHAYRLKVDGGYLILLLSQEQTPLNTLCQLFTPVLGNLARAIQLCRDSEQLAARQQAEFQDLQHFNESLLRAIPTPVFYQDNEGRFLGCNPAFSQLCGIDRLDLLGKRAEEWRPQEIAQAALARMTELTHTRQPQRIELQLHSGHDGQCYQVICFKDLFYDHQGQVAGVISALVDITRIKESEQHQRALLFQSIAALSSAITRKNRYNTTHENRVHDLALAIGQGLRLPQEQLDGIGLAAMVHNIGLLQIPSELITRPRELKPVEFALIKQHPQAGYEILKQIDFPWPIATIVLQHHENLDGTGYPNGLVGDEICLEARIIRVADSLMAMTAHRPFRRAFPLSDAFAELTRYAGIRYDESVVNVCFSLWQAGYHFTPQMDKVE